ncbi:MAG: cysteine hydrolase [Ktedonobacterales bacterium]|nr:cysteine hydrolase [Ktedonobacterales bacterium]
MNTDTALLVIDLQAGLVDPAYEEDRVVLQRTAALAEKARAAGIPVIYLQHDGEPGDSLEVGTAGWHIAEMIAPREGELVIRKRASDGFYETTLGQELRARGVKRLVVTGAMTEFCVDTTCRSALSHGYEVTLAADAHWTGDRGELTAARIIAYHNAVLADIAHPTHTITVLPSADIAF